MLPAGTVTFLFSDVEGSTRLIHLLGERFAAVLEEQRNLIRRAVEAEGGVEVDSSGDAFLAAFPRATGAVLSAAAAQRALFKMSWPDGIAVRVRMGLHTGEPNLTSTGYTGIDVHRGARICAAAHGGQVLMSETTRELVQNDLPMPLRDLGEHLLKDLTRPQRLSQLIVDGLPAEFPPLRTLNNRPNNLPIQPTPLVGRERDVQSVADLLRRTDVRLVTLTGAGGTGKTRLSLQTSANLIDEFRDGAFFVPLAHATDPSLILPAIGQVLGVRESPAVPLTDALPQYLADKQILLVLDNFEQVTEAAPHVAEVLAVAPEVKVLVTSRTVLHLRGEYEYPVPPLDLPARGRLRDVEAVSQYAAVDLFIQRAKAVRPDFTVTEANAPAIAEICYRLDGLPLAIELAAARSKLFNPGEMLARLGRPLELLTGGARDLPDRHQTLQRAIAWSYDLLDPDEQVLFQRISVFAGGCRLDAAEAVGGVAPVGIDVIDGIGALVDKSLLRRGDGPHEDTRFVMLEMIREFGLAKLRESGEEDAIRKAHAEYFRDLAEKAEPHFTGAEQVRWLDLIEKDHDNVRQALSWSVEHGEQEIGLRLGAAVWRFWIVRGLMVEGRRQLERLRQIGRPAEYSRAWVKVLNALGTLTQVVGDFPAARDILREVLDLSMEHGDRPGIASSLLNLSWVLFELGELKPARALADQARQLCRELGDRRGEASALTNLAMISHDESKFLEALEIMRQNMAIRQEIGELRGIAYATGMTASVYYHMGDYETADRLTTDAIEMSASLRDRQAPAFMHSFRGLMCLETLRFEEAETEFEQATSLWSEMGSHFGFGMVLGGQGLLALARGNVERARSLVLESLDAFRRRQQRRSIGIALTGLGHVESADGNDEEALARYAEARDILEQVGDRRTLADCYLGIAAVLRARGEVDEAGRTFEHALALLEEIGIRPTPWQVARGLLGEAASTIR